MAEASDAHNVISSRMRSAIRPNLLGIGAAKAGTTWLADILGRHEDIFMPPQKELHCLHYDDLDARLGEYADYFRGGERARIRCDFTVRYLNSPNAPKAAARVTPDAKILVVLRNPIDQVQSHYWHLRRQNFHQATAVDPAPDLFEALERFPELLREPALYAKHLKRWRAEFADDRLLIIDYDEMIAALPQVLDRLWAFLEIPPPRIPVVNEGSNSAGRLGVEPRPGALGRIYPFVYSTVTRGPYQWLKRRIGVRRAETLSRTLRLRQVTEQVFFKPGYEKLGEADRRRLYEIFRSDIEELGASGRIDVGGWTLA